MSLSIKNRWLDSEDRVYIIFTVEEIAELMNCGTEKAVRVLKELDSEMGIGLVEKRAAGTGETQCDLCEEFYGQRGQKRKEKEQKKRVNTHFSEL